MEGQIRAEPASRGLPEPLTVRFDVMPRDGTANGQLATLFRHFVRVRKRGGKAPPQDAGWYLEIDFAEEITGPICIGYGSHYGLGMMGGELSDSWHTLLAWFRYGLMTELGWVTLNLSQLLLTPTDLLVRLLPFASHTAIVPAPQASCKTTASRRNNGPCAPRQRCRNWLSNAHQHVRGRILSSPSLRV